MAIERETGFKHLVERRIPNINRAWKRESENIRYCDGKKASWATLGKLIQLPIYVRFARNEIISRILAMFAFSVAYADCWLPPYPEIQVQLLFLA